jgi:rubrerythrin
MEQWKEVRREGRAMSDKPSYLGLLNSLGVTESRAHQFFSAWIDKTPNPDLKAVLTTVCLREGEHGMIFAKRVNELGYSLREKPDPGFDERMIIASSDMSDLEKFDKLGLATDNPDFAAIFNDPTIDPRTGEILGRYIAEERDTLRMFKCCYEELVAQRDSAIAEPANSPSSASLECRVDELCQTVEELRELVGALAAATPSESARRSAKAK